MMIRSRKLLKLGEKLVGKDQLRDDFGIKFSGGKVRRGKELSRSQETGCFPCDKC